MANLLTCDYLNREYLTQRRTFLKNTFWAFLRELSGIAGDKFSNTA
jgi:hypothetical protein